MWINCGIVETADCGIIEIYWFLFTYKINSILDLVVRSI